MTQKHILVVDDDPRIRDMLGRYLESEGFAVTLAEDGAALRAQIGRDSIDLIMLDVMMPGEDGLSLTREIRAQSEVPIIMITGKGDVLDRVVGLEVGADDYIAKPFHLREVLARIRTVLRRSTAICGPEDVEREEAKPDGACAAVTFDGWRFDQVKMELRNPGGEPVALTTGEYNLLSALVRAPNRPLNRDQIMDLTHGRDWTPFDRSIDTQVVRLRRKIEADPANPKIIKTVRGVGYIFAAKVVPC